MTTSKVRRLAAAGAGAGAGATNSVEISQFREERR